MSKVFVEGKCGITVTVIADSIGSKTGDRLTTFEFLYPRFCHSELMTHRSFSRNAASSRAIPIKSVIELVMKSPATPVHWGANQAGMQAKAELQGYRLKLAQFGWSTGRYLVVGVAKFLSKVGLHKQLANRILETYQMIKVVASATEMNNFLYLRDHPDAQPEIAELARCVREAMERSKPEILEPGQWHTPYVDHIHFDGKFRYTIDNEGFTVLLSEEDALKISASCCAQVSYRKSDDSLDKARGIYDRLVNNKPVHASPFEHQGTPIDLEKELTDDDGITHMDKKGQLWSGNFCGFVQHRQKIPDNVKVG